MIYLDNASTSFHKPDCVARAVVEAMQQAGNSGRGSSGEAMEASRIILIQDAKLHSYLMWKDRNVWHLPQTRQRR